jgi:CcmD family protein
MIRTLAAVLIPALAFSWSTRVLAQAAKTPEDFQGAAANNAPDFRVYVFVAYGAVCLLLFLFSLRTISQNKRLEERVDHLEERFAASAAESPPGKGEPADSPG